MNNNQDIKNTNPLIFIKKINDKHKIIPLNITKNTLGPNKYFPSATREWFNSIYTFNSNSVKNLSIADKNLSNLIKSYFNLYFGKIVLKSERIPIRYRRSSVNKIFISKAELKHTNSKVIVNLYVYNEERRILMFKLNKLEALFSSSLYYNKNKKTLLSINNKISLIKELKEEISFIEYIKILKSSILELKQNNLINIYNMDLDSTLNNINNIITNNENTHENCNEIYGDLLRETYISEDLMMIAYYKLLLNLNKSKFEGKFLLKLKSLVGNIYNKDTEFNFINLNTMYLNSDIFTQVVSMKMKNKDNKLLKLLKFAIHSVKLPKTNRVVERYKKLNINELWINKVNNLRIGSTISKYKNSKDILNKLLLDIHHNSYNSKDSKEIASFALQNIIFNSLKYKGMGGARLETKGRLTKRFTASRSVFKVKWKGSLKNIDSSYRGLSSGLIRGHVKSNIQYSLINSKTRNGAFGLKGWLSSK